MHAFVIMHNIIVESGYGDPTRREDHPYNYQGPLATVDLTRCLDAEFANFLAPGDT
jgi:hypothetical protein